MTDVLGVANLRQKGKEWMLYMINKFRHKNTNKVPYLMSLSKGAKIALVIYTIVVNFFFGFYFLYMLPLFFIRFYHTFPERIELLLMNLSYHQMPNWGNLQQCILQIVFLFFFLYMLYRMLSPLLRKIIWKK